MSLKQAVILIHGVGEQKPMDTIRRFVGAVWTTDAAIHDPNATKGAHTLLWSKPDTVSASFELRCLTTPQNTSGVTTDFFEFYWAHLMTGTGYGHVLAWARTLLLRNPSTVPKQLRLSYWLLVGLSLAAAALFVYAIFSGMRSGLKDVSPWLSAIASFTLVPLGGFVIKNVVGDAARYLHVAPTNVQRRHEIRLAGVTLLRTLHEREEYERIIVVGHSLGSVIGYDMLTHAWVDFHHNPPTAQHPATAALDALEAIAVAAPRPPVAVIQSAQRAYMNELVANGNQWRVTDFVTLGSPLAHGAILLAKGQDQLLQKQVDREFPTCLPTLETLTRAHRDVRRFSFELKPGNYRVPHHAAVFGPTRWTNLYFPNSLIVKGDVIGGRLAPVFGPGIRDVAVSTSQWAGLFSHTLYWTFPESSPAPSHITALRDALDLVDSRNQSHAPVGP
jgi:hypothetical protein